MTSHILDHKYIRLPPTHSYSFLLRSWMADLQCSANLSSSWQRKEDILRPLLQFAFKGQLCTSLGCPWQSWRLPLPRQGKWQFAFSTIMMTGSPCWLSRFVAQTPQPSGALGQLGKEQTLPCAEYLFYWYVWLSKWQRTIELPEFIQGETVVPMKLFQKPPWGIWHAQLQSRHSDWSMWAIFSTGYTTESWDGHGAMAHIPPICRHTFSRGWTLLECP